jgi:hypothetical protein
LEGEVRAVGRGPTESETNETTRRGKAGRRDVTLGGAVECEGSTDGFGKYGPRKDIREKVSLGGASNGLGLSNGTGNTGLVLCGTLVLLG